VHVFCEILRTFGLRNSGRAWRITYYPIADQMPGGPDRRLIILNPTGPYRHLGLALKSLVQTGRDFESPFKTVRSRASSKPDWPDYWEPCFHAWAVRMSPNEVADVSQRPSHTFSWSQKEDVGHSLFVINWANSGQRRSTKKDHAEVKLLLP
jgi:hypothetical protein